MVGNTLNNPKLRCFKRVFAQQYYRSMPVHCYDRRVYREVWLSCIENLQVSLEELLHIMETDVERLVLSLRMWFIFQVRLPVDLRFHFDIIEEVERRHIP